MQGTAALHLSQWAQLSWYKNSNCVVGVVDTHIQSYCYVVDVLSVRHVESWCDVVDTCSVAVPSHRSPRRVKSRGRPSNSNLNSTPSVCIVQLFA